ncbi:unnamed protein product [Nippostrongylus brasiliensis]|uniref:Uncharacterized protein n=1 Tax=Nippostrongylus brasiliensis TaxID=27835 RepID=A0A0N4YNG7_NIPBR|nr:unnamed protein product [Nippostrongylus brasiliensis]
MLLMSRRKTINLTESKKKAKCDSCKRSNSTKPKKSSMVVTDNKKPPVVPPHASSSLPSAPPQTIRNVNDGENELNFPEPPSTFAGGNNGRGGGGGGGADLDFDELARRFDQLKKK